MNKTQQLRDLGQSLWLDNITRKMLDVLARFAQAGVGVDALALQLQRDGAQAFVKSWKELLERIAGKSAALAGADKENA